MNDILVTRKTTESNISVRLDFSGIASDYRKRINTGILFLDHMIEQLVWRSEITIDTSVSLDRFHLSHVICEDLGITMGKAFLKAVRDNLDNGIAGYGFGVGIIDEAKASAAISFEERAYLDFDDHGVAIPQTVEGMASEDLITFLDGFVQGARCTLHLDLDKGQNGHHIWEAAFRSFGICLKEAMTLVASRKSRTSGVAGKIEFTIK